MQTRRRLWWIAGLGIAALIVIVLAPMASADPDGLESVGGELGFLEGARDALYSIIPDYAFPGIDDPVISTIVAGLVGVAIVAGLMYLLGRSLTRRKA